MDFDATSIKALNAIILKFTNCPLCKEYLLTELDLYGLVGEEVSLSKESILPKPLMASYDLEVELKDGSVALLATVTLE
jgi:hypothetical protein